MNKEARISLAQWRALIAVVDAGGYAQAAEQLNKTQSSVSYAIHKLESLLDIKVFEVQGRKAVLTPTGQTLTRRAGQLLAAASDMEQAAQRLSQGWEPEVRLAVDHLFPMDCLFRVLDEFSQQAPQTRVRLHETVLSGNDEALTSGKVDLALCPWVPVGFLGDPILPVEFIAVAHPEHALHQTGRELSYQDLQRHRQVVIRDSAQHQSRDAGWLGAEQRWTVSHMHTSIRAVSQGLGFAWFPKHSIEDELAQDILRPLPLREGGKRQGNLHLVFADKDYAGRATCLLGELFRHNVTDK